MWATRAAIRRQVWILPLLLFCSAAGSRSEPRIIAHRGASLEAPENTIPAIERAIALGAALVEVDPRYTKDAQIVLMHDETLNRTTNGSGRVSETSFAEIRGLDAGSCYDKKYSGTKVPALREVLQVARGRIQVYMDMKETDPMPIVKLVLAMDAEAYVYFRPYSFEAVRQITSADPALRVLIDLEDWLQVPGILPALHKAIPTGCFSGSLHIWRSEMLGEARRLGVATFVNVLGPEDTPANLERAVSMGFDFIQTDHPRDLMRILAAWSPRGARKF